MRFLPKAGTLDIGFAFILCVIAVTPMLLVVLNDLGVFK